MQPPQSSRPRLSPEGRITISANAQISMLVEGIASKMQMEDIGALVRHGTGATRPMPGFGPSVCSCSDDCHNP